MSDAFFDEDRDASDGEASPRAGMEVGDAPPAPLSTPIQKVIQMNRMKRLHDGRSTRVSRIVRDGGPDVIDAATSTPAEWEVKMSATMAREAAEAEAKGSVCVSMAHQLGPGRHARDMPVAVALELIPHIFEELVQCWGLRVYHDMKFDVEWCAKRKRACRIQFELATNATVRRLGLKTLALSHLRALCKCVEKHWPRHVRLKLFGELFGLLPTAEPHGVFDVGPHVALFARLWPAYFAACQAHTEHTVHNVLLGSGKFELRAILAATAAVFKHTRECVAARLNHLKHTFKKDVRGGMVDADDALAIIMAFDRWPVELAKSRLASTELRGCLCLQRSLVRFRRVVRRKVRQRALWVDHFDKAATPEGCLDYEAFYAAVLGGVEEVPSEALVMRLYNEWGTAAEAIAARERAAALDALAAEISALVVQKNFIVRCWKRRGEHSQKEALTFLRGKKGRWSANAIPRLAANLALRRWRRRILEADAGELFADCSAERAVGLILEARRGFGANSRAFSNVMVAYGFDCDETATANKVLAKAVSDRHLKDSGPVAPGGVFPHPNKKKKKRRGRRFA